MNILLLGSGGREHAMALALAKSPLLTRLFAAPGNPGIAALARCAALDLADHGAVIGFCKANAVDLVVVGPEAPLVAGLVDDLEACGIKAFGPRMEAARTRRLESFRQGILRAFRHPDRRLRPLR